MSYDEETLTPPSSTSARAPKPAAAPAAPPVSHASASNAKAGDAQGQPIGHEAKESSAPEPGAKKAPERLPKQVSKEKVAMRERLPALADDADVAVEKKQVVTRDGKADLAFTGVLVASAAPEHTIEDHWWEYRVYLTNGGKHVFSKVDRSVYEGEDDAWTAEVFDPSPSSVPSQLLRSARELARSKPVTWQEAAVSFYGYGPIAKALYRKLDGPFEEQIE